MRIFYKLKYSKLAKIVFTITSIVILSLSIALPIYFVLYYNKKSGQTPGQTLVQTPGQTPGQTLVQTPGQTLVQTPSKTLV